LRHQSVGRTLGADAEQGVDGKVKLVWCVFGKFDTSTHGSLPCVLRIDWRMACLARPCDDGMFAPSVQMNGSFQPVATVVAWTTRNPNCVCMWRDG
jgi:hypothetical protein